MKIYFPINHIGKERKAKMNTGRNNTFVDRLQAAQLEKKSVLCVGLDPQLRFMPPHLIEWARHHYGDTEEAIGQLFSRFNKLTIDAVCDFASSVKPQAAFYERSHHTWRALEETISYAESKGLIHIKDAKRQDGSETADEYARAHIGTVPFFDGQMVVAPIRTDALTIGGYIGEDCVGRFVNEMKENGTGAFVVCKTSFKPNSAVEQLVTENGLTVWERLAHYVKLYGEGTEGKNGYTNLGVVMGATYPEDAPKMRVILPNAIMLIPGAGKQGGSATNAVVTFNADGFGGAVNDARNIIAAWQDGPFACDPANFADAQAKSAKHSRDKLTKALRTAGKCAW